MLVVIGNLAAREENGRIRAAGMPAGIARTAASAGAAVQIVGRVGEDPPGDALLVDLAAAGVGHVAVLRTPGRQTPVRPSAEPDVVPDDEGLAGAIDSGEGGDDEMSAPDEADLGLDADDLQLALRYLPDYRVLVVAPGLAPAGLATVVSAAAWSGARLIVVVDQAGAPSGLPADATVLERPAGGDEEAFAAVIAHYAVALDGGAEPRAAFASASTGAGWTSVTD